MIKNNIVYGVIGIGVNKGNYNASFDKTPKADSNGVMYATPQCLQYAIKHQAQKQGKNVLYKRSFGEQGIRTLKDNFKCVTGIDLDKSAITENGIKKILLTECIDTTWFGCTFTGKGNIGIMGAIQIGFGTNRYEETEIIVDDILSPFKNPNEGDAKMASKGTQVIVDEAHYTHSFTINPFEYNQYKLELDGYEGFTEDAYNQFKEASLIAVSNYNSRTKSGCQNEFALFVEANDDELNKTNLNGLDRYIKVEKDIDTGKVIYDLTIIAEILNGARDTIKNIEIYYNPYTLNIIGDIKQAKIFNIINKKEV